MLHLRFPCKTDKSSLLLKLRIDVTFIEYLVPCTILSANYGKKHCDILIYRITTVFHCIHSGLVFLKVHTAHYRWSVQALFYYITTLHRNIQKCLSLLSRSSLIDNGNHQGLLTASCLNWKLFRRITQRNQHTGCEKQE